MKMKNYIGVLFLFWVFLSGNIFSSSMNVDRKGIDEFLTFLKENKDTLKYSTYGLIEHDEEVVIKIYCPKNSKLLLLENLKDYKHKEIAVEDSSADQIIFSVTFYKIKSQKEEPKTTPVPAKEVETRPVKKQVLEEKKVSEGKKVVPRPETKKEKVVKKKCPRKVKVQVKEMIPQTFKEYKYFEKAVSPDQEVELAAQLTANVKDVLVSVGDRVNKGQILVTFDSTELEKEVKSLQSSVEKWKVILYKRQHWKERSPRAEKQAEDKLQEAKELLAEKEAELAGAQIPAPMDGKVIFVVSPDEPLELGATVLKMETDHIMKAEIGEEDARLFTEGQEINITSKDFEETLLGVVSKIDNETKIRIKNEGFKLTSDMKVNFRVLLKTYEDALVLAESEILKDETGSFVYIVVGKRASRRDLALGPVEEGQVLILSGLVKGHEVIITDVDCLKEKKKIKVMVYDPVAGILKPRKLKKIPIKKVEKIEVIKPKVEVIEKKYVLRVGVGGGHTVMIGSSYTDSYGIGGFYGLLSFAYPISNKIEIFLDVSYLTKTGTFVGADNPEAEISNTMIPLYLGGRFFFKKIKKFQPYIGAALVYYTVYEKYSADWLEDIDESGFGFALCGGTLWKINSKLNLFFDLKYDYIRIKPLNGETSDLSGFRPTLGISIKF